MPKRRQSSNYVVLLVEDRAGINGGGPARVCIQRRAARQREMQSFYATALARASKRPQAAATPPPRTATANMDSPVQLHVTKTPLALVDRLNIHVHAGAPRLALAACAWPFRCERDARRIMDEWREAAGSGSADRSLAVGYDVVARVKRKYAADLGLVYGDVAPGPGGDDSSKSSR